MNYSTFRFTLDLHTMQSQISIPVKYGDTAVSLRISLTDGGVPLAIEDGCRAVFSARKADETTILNNCVIEKNSIIRYDFTEHTATAEGIARCEITLYGANGEALGSPRFVIVVDKRVIGSENVISQSERDAIDSIIILGTEAVANEEERKANEKARKEAEDQRLINEANRQQLYNFTSADAGKFVVVDMDGSITATEIMMGGIY